MGRPRVVAASVPGDQPSPSTYGRLSTEEAFALVGNEIRREILLALSEPDEGGREPAVLSFSELYSRVDVDTNTSQFNYHLQQLLGHFVESRGAGTAHLNERFEEDDESAYALRPEGLLLVWTVRAGSATGDPALESFDAGFRCYHCQTPVEAVYENSVFKVQCPGCGYHYDYNLTPPGVVSGTDDREEILDRVANYNRTVRGAFARGNCPLCAGAVDERFVDPEETRYPRPEVREAFVHRACAHCGYVDYLTVGEFLLTDAAVISFCYDRGVDVTTGRLWDLEFVATDAAVTVADTDPWEVRFELALDGDALVVDVHDDLTVSHRSSP